MGEASNSPEDPPGAICDDTGRTQSRIAAAGMSPTHPMLPPRNASSKWYPQTMNLALHSYQSGTDTGAGATSAISLRR